MENTTKEKVKTFVRDFVVKTRLKLRSWSLSDLKRAYPFHSLFFPDEALLASKNERSVVTAMGQGFYPRLAQLVAEEKYTKVFLNFTVGGPLNDAACNRIEELITELRTGRRRPDHDSEISDILAHTGGGMRTTETKADFYIDDFINGPLFIEIKSPLPNLDIAAESKKKILYFLAIKNREGMTGAAGYLAFPYNPFLTREFYSHSFTKRIMDMEKEVLMGEEFWNLIGGPACFSELLDVIDQVKSELS